jgi:RHS repeat-associated protein
LIALISFVFAAIGQADSPDPAKVNRTVPNVAPPKTGLEFSGRPTVQEIFRARVFEEPLVPIGGEPGAEENAALAKALLSYAKRSGPDDFSSLTEFLDKYSKSPWRAALLTDLGLEYYNTAHYSLALEAWEKAWPLVKEATDMKGKAIADRAAGELAFMYARLGRMTDLEALLKSVESRGFVGAATEKITGAREGLWNMQHRPEISFKCGPYALQRILLSDQRLLTSSPTNAVVEIFNFPSTKKGVSLPQVAELSKKIGLNYQMAFRASKAESGKQKAEIEERGDFIVPSVVHWKVGHYAAMVRQEGDKYLLEDPTFGNTVWATREALEAETSGYFLIPTGDLPRGWRSVDAKEGASVWGKGVTSGPDPDPPGPKPKPCKKDKGMAVSSVHLMAAGLNITDTPVGHSPPVGPSVEFTVAYNHRDARQPANFTYANLGPKWTCDWVSYITDNPLNLLADVNYYIPGGGTRTFTGFTTNTQTFAAQLYDQTRLTRTGNNSYEMTSPDGSKMVFSQSDGASGSSRKIFLTQILDPFGNAVTLTYDGNLRIAAITDAIGQVTTLTYGNTNDIYKITRVTDPFGRFADFAYDSLGRLTNITDVIGINSRFTYESTNDFINALITPYGTNSFTRTDASVVVGGGPTVVRSLETLYPDGSRDRVEFNQSTNTGVADFDPPATVPAGMLNAFLEFRNSFYWSRTACASGYGDYSKAKTYHWLHGLGTVTSGVLESTKEPLENRVWYSYPGQEFSGPNAIGSSSRPARITRVLEDGSSQIYSNAYDGFGHVTNSVDPLGRTFRYLYASNEIDLLEVRQTRAGNNELLGRMTYNAQHLPLMSVGADGQTNTFTYNARGQLLTETNPKGETTAYTYDTNGYLIAVDGPLPGTNDTVTMTYDALGRTLTKTDVSGYTLTFEHDNMDRLTKISHPDSTFEQFIFNRLDVTNIMDRAGRQTLLDYDNMRQMKKKTDPLGRVTLFDWCRCGQLKSLTDPMGRTTSWETDVQERVTAKQYGDGSQIKYVYENASSRLREVIDEKQQLSHFTYNLDDTLKSVAYANATVPTPAVSYTYDPNYNRLTSMTDGTGTTLYSYNPVTTTPALGANQLASVDGPLPNDTITYSYDELGRPVSTAINGVASRMTYDAGGRVTTTTNALGVFTMVYDGSTGRVLTNTFPNGQTESRSYGSILQDLELQRITHKVGATPISEFLYGHDLPTDRITTWSQQVGATPPSLHTFGYDSANQLLSATVTNSGNLVNTLAYAYDSAANRLVEQVGASNYFSTFNALNQINATTTLGVSRTNEWDARDRLVAVNVGTQRTEFTYDGLSRMVSIRQLTNGSEMSLRRFVWCNDRLCEERGATGAVTKRFFTQGMKVESGPNVGSYFYTRDHLGSIRELTDNSGSVRARYSYDPFGRRMKLAGDLEADFGFTGLFFAVEAGLSVARFRAYDADTGRWLSRDTLRNAEMKEGPNLYAYVRNNPVNLTDPLGLAGVGGCCDDERKNLERWRKVCPDALKIAGDNCTLAKEETPEVAPEICSSQFGTATEACLDAVPEVQKAAKEYIDCLIENGCRPPKKPCPKPGPAPKPEPGPKPDPKPYPKPKCPFALPFGPGNAVESLAYKLTGLCE